MLINIRAMRCRFRQPRAGQPTESRLLYALSVPLPQVFDSMRRALNTKRRERCVRLDPAAGTAAAAAAGAAGSLAAGPVAGTILGLEELERAMKEAIRACFEARTAAYDEEVSWLAWWFCGCVPMVEYRALRSA